MTSRDQDVDLFDDAMHDIKRRRERRLDGNFNSIPIGLSRFSEHWPGIEQETLNIISADTKAGKTKFAKQLFVHDVLDFMLTHPDTDINVEIFYFCLEESKRKFIQSLQLYRLFKKHKIRRGIKELRSAWEPLTEEELKLLEDDKEFFDFARKHLHIIDDVRHPYGIYKVLEDHFHDHGEVITKKVWRTNDAGEREQKDIFDYYVPHDPNLYTIGLIDHIGKVHPQKKHKDLHEAMSEMSQFGMDLRDKFGASMVFVQQLAIYSAAKQYNRGGDKIIEALEPSIDKLGDNKLLARDADNIFFLFGPSLYKISSYERYDIDTLGNHFRALIVGRARDMDDGLFIPMFFDGKVGWYEELPDSDDMSSEKYSKYMNRVTPIKATSTSLEIDFRK